MTEEQIDEMAKRFLQWRLPKDFSPDAGVSFAPSENEGDAWWPVGTNLFTYEQAREMIKHMLGD